MEPTFRDDQPLGLNAPTTPASNPDPDIDPASWLRSVNYMVDHMCEPICPSRLASCGSNRALEGGDREPLTSSQWELADKCCGDAAKQLRELARKAGMTN